VPKLGGVRLPPRAASAAAGAALVVVGVVGAVPGLYRAGTLLTGVHLASGAVGLACARRPRAARLFPLAGGVAYLGLWLLGPLRAGGWIPLDLTDNSVHFATGIALLGLSARARR